MPKSTPIHESRLKLRYICSRNPELLELLADHYENLRRYRDADRIQDRLIELEPDQPLFLLYKTLRAFYEKGDLKPVRAAFEALPSSAKNDVFITIQRIYYAMCDHDFKTAHEIVSKSPNEEIFFSGAIVPRQCADIWLEMVQGNHPTMEEFGVTREQVFRKVAADPTNAALLSSLACVDIGLGRKEEAVSEGKRATEMVPISKDALQGPGLVYNLALVYAWADEPDLAFEQLSILIKVPNNCQVTYGTLKVDPSWDPLRKDPRFEKFLADRRIRLEDSFNQKRDRPARSVGGKTFWRGHLNPFVAGRLRNLWPAAIFPNLKPEFQENRGCRRSYSQAYTASFLGLSAAAHE